MMVMKHLFRNYRTQVFVFLCYFVLAVVSTLPLVFHFRDSFPSDHGDASKYVWNLWWMGKAVTGGRNPFYSDGIYYPYGAGLTYDAATPLRSFLALPFYFLFGLIPAHNIMILFSLTLMGVFMYLLAKEVARDDLAAFLAGVLFMTSPYVAGKVEAHINLSELQYLPLFLLGLFRLKRVVSLGNRLLVSGSFVAIFLTDYYQFFLACLMGALFLLVEASGKPRKSIITTVAIACLMLSPFFVFFIKDFFYYKYPVISEAEKLLVDPVRFVTPTQRIWFYRTFFADYSSSWVRSGEEVFLGIFPLLFFSMSFLRIARAKSMRFFILCFGVAVVLSLGPYVRFGGIDYPAVRLPFEVFLKAPIIQNLRASSRFMMMILVSFSVLFAYSFARVSKDRTLLFRSILFAISLCLVLAEYLSVSLGLESVNVSKFFYALREKKEPVAIWTVPTEFWLDETRAALAQTVHEKPTLGGFVSRPSQRIIDAYYALPIIGDVIAHQYESRTFPYLTTEERQKKKQDGLRYLKEHHIQYVVFYKNVSDAIYKNHQLIGFFQQFIPLPPSYEDDQVMVFKVY